MLATHLSTPPRDAHEVGVYIQLWGSALKASTEPCPMENTLVRSYTQADDYSVGHVLRFPAPPISSQHPLLSHLPVPDPFSCPISSSTRHL